MSVCTDHIFDVAAAGGVEVRGKSIVLCAIAPVGGHRIALHKEAVGIRARWYSQRSVPIDIILDVTTQRGLSAVSVTRVGRAQNVVCDSNRQLDILIREGCGRSIADVFADLQHCWLSPAGIKPLLHLIYHHVSTFRRRGLRTCRAGDDSYGVLNVPVI